MKRLLEAFGGGGDPNGAGEGLSERAPERAAAGESDALRPVEEVQDQGQEPEEGDEGRVLNTKGVSKAWQELPVQYQDCILVAKSVKQLWRYLQQDPLQCRDALHLLLHDGGGLGGLHGQCGSGSGLPWRGEPQGGRRAKS